MLVPQSVQRQTKQGGCVLKMVIQKENKDMKEFGRENNNCIIQHTI